MKVFVVIISYNGIKWIDNCFGSLYNSSISIDIIVIDNGSIDGTPEIIRNKYPSVKVIETGQNLGFGKANNIGIQKAFTEGADYIFLLNQDAWIEKDTIKNLIKISINHPDFAVVSPIHLNSTGDYLDYNFSICTSPEYCPSFSSDSLLNKLKDQPYETKMVNAAAWLISRKCIETIGGFNPLFFLYGEDDNYLDRVRFHGLKVGIYPSSNIYHDREKREINSVLAKKMEFEYIQFLVKFSNPSCKDSLNKYMMSILLKSIKNIVLLNYSQTISTIKTLLRIRRIRTKIIYYRKISMNKGLSFLD